MREPSGPPLETPPDFWDDAPAPAGVDGPAPAGGRAAAPARAVPGEPDDTG
ncbi:MAG TPA: hypothetical protein VIL48_17465 [Acidimicrobiales bacterium]